MSLSMHQLKKNDEKTDGKRRETQKKNNLKKEHKPHNSYQLFRGAVTINFDINTHTPRTHFQISSWKERAENDDKIRKR